MRIQMLDLRRFNTRLTNSGGHGATRAVTVFRTGSQVISIRAGAITD